MTALDLQLPRLSALRAGLRWEPLAWAITCSVLFLLVYGGTNLVAAQHGDLPSIHFTWERHTPFLPWMILPYWSMDLLFVISFFLPLGTREDLRRHARRMVAAIAIAGVCFLLFPLEMGFDRPSVEGGTWGRFFAVLHAVDQPHNLAPSLHVALVVVLLAAYDRVARGWMRWTVWMWFGLIGVSTLFTHQHHLFDAITGLALGIGCLWWIPDPFTPTERARHPRIAAQYCTVAAVLVIAAWITPPFGLVLLWPAVSCAIVGLGYAGLGAAVFRKRNGRLPISTIVLLGPYLLGAKLSHRYFARRLPKYGEIAPNVIVGRRLSSREARELRSKLDIVAALDLTAEYTEPAPLRELPYLNVPILDFTAPTQAQLDEAAEFVRRHARNGPVYVHCALGVQRSAAVAAACTLTGDESSPRPRQVQGLSHRISGSRRDGGGDQGC